MAKIQCYNCKKVTPVVAPRYRCKFCNYPLNKYIESDNTAPDEVIIDNPELKERELQPLIPIVPIVPITPIEPERIENALQDNKNALQDNKNALDGIQNLLSKLRPDEKVEKAATGTVIVKKNKNPEKAGKIIAGWLVVHTENKLPTTYDLYEGNNVIGRPDGPYQIDVRIEDDDYVSRVHAFIHIDKDYLHRFRYELLDNGSLTKGKVSTNGTYINGIGERLPKEKSVFLRDGDTVQIGTTKLVFKSINEADDHISAFSSVASSNFTETVAIRR